MRVSASEEAGPPVSGVEPAQPPALVAEEPVQPPVSGVEPVQPPALAAVRELLQVGEVRELLQPVAGQPVAEARQALPQQLFSARHTLD